MVRKQSKFTIFLFVVLVISAIIIFDVSYLTSQEPAKVEENETEKNPSIPSEEGVFKRSEYALDYTNMPTDEKHQRSLKTYYENRAFPGAPPTIPHSLISEKSIGGLDCLQCHENGGFVAKFEAYAPITPHPEMLNCRQCHVPSQTKLNFKTSNWIKYPHPQIRNSALEGSPPIIPHLLQMRENCLACHAGPAAPVEIKVSHPMRINCRQCHAQGNKTIEWSTTEWTRSSSNSPK